MNESKSCTGANDRSRTVWRSRGYLPHYDAPGLFQLITYRLADSLPAVKLAELRRRSSSLTAVQARDVLEDYLDSGAGDCHLRHPYIAALVQENLLRFDGERYHLCAWVIMPNHVHVLAQFNAESTIAQVLHAWKSYTANFANQQLGRSGAFWQREYFDRYIRNAEHYRNAVQYIEWNPVKARLVETPAAWPYSSAALHDREFG